MSENLLFAHLAKPFLVFFSDMKGNVDLQKATNVANSVWGIFFFSLGKFCCSNQRGITIISLILESQEWGNLSRI